MNTFEKIRAIVAKTAHVEEYVITEDSHLASDLGADSLDAVDIL